jgi:hypothetical protein
MDTQPTPARECEVFCRYLVGRAPDEYVARKYAEAHATGSATGRAAPAPPLRFAPASAFDAALLRFAARGPAWTSLADSYACIAARRSAMRRKLVLLAAILESCDASHGFRDGVDDTAAAAVILGGAARGLLFAMRLLLAAILLGPLHLALGGSPAAEAR